MGIKFDIPHLFARRTHQGTLNALPLPPKAQIVAVFEIIFTAGCDWLSSGQGAEAVTVTETGAATLPWIWWHIHWWSSTACQPFSAWWLMIVVFYFTFYFAFLFCFRSSVFCPDFNLTLTALRVVASPRYHPGGWGVGGAVNERKKGHATESVEKF